MGALGPEGLNVIGPMGPEGLDAFLRAVIAGALVVVFGAVYAACFAFGRLFSSVILMRVAYGCFGLLMVTVYVLATSLQLGGIWNVLMVLLLVAYFVAPRMIWRLTAATHE
ncbi:MAG: hypothetical protein R3F27_07730 [Gammaproteobacteria bacterium]